MIVWMTIHNDITIQAPWKSREFDMVLSGTLLPQSGPGRIGSNFFLVLLPSMGNPQMDKLTN